jgi:signal transduction histidine kinase
VRRRNEELQRSIRGTETTTEIARALGGITDLDRVLELVVKRSRALIDARATGPGLIDGDEIVIAAVAGEGADGLRGTRVPTALIAPMMFRNRAIGFLSAFDRLNGDATFTDEDERLMQAFAASAATAVATAQSADAEAVRRSLDASEEERRRWARELHDEALQELAGLKILIGGARRSDDMDRVRGVLDQSLEIITQGIANLRALITELRPAALDELGTQPALEALVARLRAQTGLDIDLLIDLAYEAGREAERHTPELELAVFRLVQEGLNNVTRHAEAQRAEIRVAELDDEGLVAVEIRDDGRASIRTRPARASACSACASASPRTPERSTSGRRAGEPPARPPRVASLVRSVTGAVSSA